ncbi:MAG: sulfatase [Bryobacterales bacterium]|nr:sulfatase [Bryobacterales bacterium]
MDRRQFLALTSQAPALLRAQSQRPNVLMIAVDDWNDWIATLGGHPQVKTPNVDRLAARGLLFTDAHTASPLCNPSRSALMTGRRPTTSGVYDNDQPWRAAMPNVITLPQHFRANGYAAYGAGKLFHHGRGYNDPRCWDEYFHWNPKARANGMTDGYSFPPDPEPARPVTPMPSVSWRNFDWAPLEAADDEMPDYKVASWTASMLARKHTKPFFLAAGMFRPHIPWFVPRKYFDMYPLDEIVVPQVKEDDLADLPPAARQIALNEHSRHDLLVSTGNWKKAVQAYLACITFSDAMIGRMLDALDQSAYRDNTVICFWSDHGYHLGEKWHWHKQALWQRATHVPLIFHVPGLTKANTRCHRPVDLANVYPTLADAAGLPVPAGVDGVSLRPLLADPSANWQRPAISTYLHGNNCVFTERWHYIRYHDGSEELYDRRQDPAEWINLATQTSTQPLRKELAAMLPRDAPNSPRANTLSFDPATVTWRPKA